MESNSLGCELHLVKSLGEGGRRQIAKTGLLSLPVVKDLDVLYDGLSSLSACREPAVMHEFVLSDPQKLSIGALS